MCVKITVFWDIYYSRHLSVFLKACCNFKAESSSTLKIEARNPSEMLINIYQTMWHHIPEAIIFIIPAVITSNLT
jgi:hypothetical protein